jgi:hypothetical protein
MTIGFIYGLMETNVWRHLNDAIFFLIKRVSPQFHSYETELSDTAVPVKFRFE